MAVIWDAAKERLNRRKHGIRFAPATLALDDPYAVTEIDHESDPQEERFVTMGADPGGSIVVLVYTYYGTDIRIISARTIWETAMKKEYDFSKGKRGPVLPQPSGTKRVTIRLGNDILEHFYDQVERAGGGNYQTLINDALRAFIEGQVPSLEQRLRKIIREELRKAS